MRYLALPSLAFFVACQDSTAAPPIVAAPAPRNLVCERVAIGNPKATCTPELTDAGDLHAHTARVTIEKDTVACGLDAAHLSVICGGMFATPAKEPDETKPATPPPAKKPTPKR